MVITSALHAAGCDFKPRQNLSLLLLVWNLVGKVVLLLWGLCSLVGCCFVCVCVCVCVCACM